MGNEVQSNVPPIQPSPQTPVSAPTQPTTNWSNILLFTALGLGMVSGLIFVGVQIGKNQTSDQQRIVAQLTASPTQNVVNPTASLYEPSISPNSVSDWKLYVNSVLNYSFKYPKVFKLAEESSNSVRVSNNFPPDPNCKGGGCNLEIPRLTIYFEHLNNPGEDLLTLEQLAQERRNSLLNINNEQGNIQSLSKYGYEMKYFDGITEGYNHNYCLKLNKNTSFVITVVFPSREEAVKYSELESQILSTFKIIN